MPKEKDTSTKSFVLRVDAATMDALERWAADEFRSINGQLQWIIQLRPLRPGFRLHQPPPLQGLECGRLAVGKDGM